MISQQMSASTKAHNEAISQEALRALSAGATPDQGAAPLVGTGSWFSCGHSAAETFCREMESLAGKKFDEGREGEADSLYHAAEIVRRQMEREKKRQPQENVAYQPRRKPLAVDAGSVAVENAREIPPNNT